MLGNAPTTPPYPPHASPQGSEAVQTRSCAGQPQSHGVSQTTQLTIADIVGGWGNASAPSSAYWIRLRNGHWRRLDCPYRFPSNRPGADPVVGLWGCLELCPGNVPQLLAYFNKRLGLECHAPGEQTVLNLPCSSRQQDHQHGHQEQPMTTKKGQVDNLQQPVFWRCAK